MVLTRCRPALLLATTLTAFASLPARADDDAKLSALEHQIQAMQAELRALKHDMAAHTQAVKQAAAQAARAQATADARAVLTTPAYPQIPAGYALVPAGAGATPGSVELARVLPPGPKLPQGTFEVGGVSVTLGGYLEAAGGLRSRNEVADLNSSFNTGIPLANSPLYHENQTFLTARNSRFSAMAQGKPDSDTTLTGYFEGDWLGAAPTANSQQTNSYNPRLRHAYLAYDRSDLGFYVLGGQTWSLLTMDKVGIPYLVKNVNSPIMIDPTNVVGYTFARQPQIRVVKTFAGTGLTIAASAENPQTLYYAGPNGAAPAALGTVNDVNAGGSGYYSGNNYSTEIAPDLIGKVAYDTSIAHLEGYGVARFFHDRVSDAAGFLEKGAPATGESHTTHAGGLGAAALVHVLPGLLDLQGNFLAGDGIGRYGTAQLPDATIGANGKPQALRGLQALVGLIGHPTTDIDVYAYGGVEETKRDAYDVEVKGKEVAYGYGNPLYSNVTCNQELGATSSCVANTSGIAQGTIGAWWKFEHGSYGTMQVGPQYSYTHRTIFQGVGPTPKTDENTLLVSLRYYPFQ